MRGHNHPWTSWVAWRYLCPSVGQTVESLEWPWALSSLPLWSMPTRSLETGTRIETMSMVYAITPTGCLPILNIQLPGFRNGLSPTCFLQTSLHHSSELMVLKSQFRVGTFSWFSKTKVNFWLVHCWNRCNPASSCTPSLPGGSGFVGHWESARL